MSQRLSLVSLVALLCAANVVAQTSDAVPYAQRPVQAGDWEFSLTPYLWFPMTGNADATVASIGAGAGGNGGNGGGNSSALPGLGGGSAAGMAGGGGGGSVAALDVSDDSSFFSDIGISPNARFEVRGSPWVFHFDGRYFDQDTDARTSTGGAATMEFEGISGELGVGFEAATWKTDEGGSGHWDVYVGARATSLDTEIRAGTIRVDIESEWLDIMVGTRVACEFTKDWVVSAGLGIGGFGLAESNELTLDAYLAVGYRIAENIDLELGWRVLVLDREENGVDYNLTMHGPSIGAVIRF